MEKRWVVYEHVSPSNKVYVGITCQKPQKRWKGGSGYVRKDHHQMLFENAILKYGWDNIQHNIIATNLNREDACKLEQELIAKYKKEKRSYNITNGGDGGLGTKHTEETKLLLSKIHKGKKQTKERAQFALNSRINNYKHLVIAIKPNTILFFKTNSEAAKALNINSPSNISGSVSGSQCLVNGYIFVYWDKSKPIDKEYLYKLYNEKVKNRYNKNKL